MTVQDWISESSTKVRDYGFVNGVKASAGDFWGGVARRVSKTLSLDEYGTNVYDKHWDVLILLDTCRPDVLAEVSDSYSFLPETPGTLTSVGSTSWEWMEKTFSEDYRDQMAATTYICGNANASNFGGEFSSSRSDFGFFDPVWTYGWDTAKGNDPDFLTRRAIHAHRNRDPDRLIIHYMQPHAPYPSLDIPSEYGVWDALRAGIVTRDEAWDAYRQNLHRVLSEVERLLVNIDADNIVISSDHGECFGEHGFYGHYRHVPTDSHRIVPWVSVSGEDTGTIDGVPPENDPESLSNTDLEERLSVLGYK